MIGVDGRGRTIHRGGAGEDFRTRQGQEGGERRGGGGSLWDTLWRSMGLLLFKKTAVLGLLDERKRPHRGFAGEAFEGAFKPTS